ncbi:hypothetical protein N7481_001563 [Penicillium waksmanii]|uniref:uncharacterized protein n=1 Tax=Penicillium waksmanii TaxID=69791 RepID=UPI0025479FEC|nr:uncharacterized protein N7481_001563 [Penicillium waksmanii]KAJ6001154.1 hypothetical protein N7481_001563 [Penicillium waksmanii]
MSKKEKLKPKQGNLFINFRLYLSQASCNIKLRLPTPDPYHSSLGANQGIFLRLLLKVTFITLCLSPAMVVIWGLDLHEIHYSKFKSSYMFSRAYHLRCTKMIVYQLAMILCVCSESVGTAALSATFFIDCLDNRRMLRCSATPLDYLDQQSMLQGQHPGVKIHNNDFIGGFSYNIFVGICVAWVFGAAFFFDLFWPERHESRAVRLAWRICAVIITFMMLGSALTISVITAMHEAEITGTDVALAREYWSETAKKPALSKGLPSSSAHKHDDHFGPKSEYGQSKESDKVASEQEESPDIEQKQTWQIK